MSSYSTPTVESKVFPEYAGAIAADALKGKTFAVTGCTSGTGLSAAKLLAQKGGSVFLLNRASPRAEAALAAVEAVKAEGAAVVHVDCDLMDFASVRAAAEKVLASTGESGLDVLCNNAGIMAVKDEATKDGYDVQMQTNHLSHFLLTKELYPALVKASELRGDARIVNHSSMARRMGGPMTAEVAAEYLGKNGGNLGGDDGGFDGTAPGRWMRYHFTKLANVVFTLELAGKLPPKLKALCCAPGLAATNLAAVSHSDGFGEVKGFMDTAAAGNGTGFMEGVACQSAEDGAVPLLTCCLSDGVSSGEFYEPRDNGGWVGPAALIPFDSEGPDAVVLNSDRAALWAASEKAVGAFSL